MLEQHPLEHVARLTMDPALSMPVFISTSSSPESWVVERAEAIKKHRRTAKACDLPVFDAAILACIHSVERIRTAETPDKCIQLLPENDTLYSTRYCMCCAVSQILYKTTLSKNASKLLAAMFGRYKRQGGFVANVIYTEMSRSRQLENRLPEEVFASIPFSDISVTIASAFVRCCSENKAFGLILELRSPQCFEIWQKYLMGCNTGVDMVDCLRQAVYSRVDQQSTVDRQASSMNALLMRITGGNMPLGIAPFGTSEALESIKGWSIDSNMGKYGPPGRISLCVSCLRTFPILEMPRMCFECRKNTVIFFDTATHRLSDKTVMVSKCCINNHPIQSDDVESSQLGSGYAICREHRIKFQWIRPSTLGVERMVRVGISMNKWIMIVSKHKACYAKKKNV